MFLIKDNFMISEIAYIHGSSDVFGLNHYTTNLVYRNESAVGYYESPSFYDDLEAIMYQKSEWKIGESDFIKVRVIRLLSGPLTC